MSHLEDMILNPERLDGKTGTDYRSWAKAARKEISQAIQEAETSAAFRELISANRIGGLCVKLGFYCLLQWPLSQPFGMASCLSGLSTALYGDLVHFICNWAFGCLYNSWITFRHRSARRSEENCHRKI